MTLCACACACACAGRTVNTKTAMGIAGPHRPATPNSVAVHSRSLAVHSRSLAVRSNFANPFSVAQLLVVVLPLLVVLASCCCYR